MNCIDGKVVVWKSEDRELGYEGSGVWKLDESGRSGSSGGSGKRKRGEVTATLHEHWRCSSSDDSGVGAAYWTNEPRPSEPVFCCEVCPPGQHFLTRGVDTPCLRFGLPHCRGRQTHRCARCPWWRCADDSCIGAAWDDSPALVDRWNRCAGVTCSRILDPVRTKETPYIYSFYDNEEVPWGIADGSIERGGYWASYAGYDTLFSFSQYQSGGRRGMTRGRNQRDGLGWGLVRKVEISWSFSSRRAASS